jgi:hypothetical protein
MICIATLLPMSSPARPSLPIRQALDRSEPLARLTQRLQVSRHRYEAICELLPAELRGLAQPGPIDDQTWTLLAANSAVAAKLRNMVPALQSRLKSHGWPELALRVRVPSQR